MNHFASAGLALVSSEFVPRCESYQLGAADDALMEGEARAEVAFSDAGKENMYRHVCMLSTTASCCLRRCGIC